MVSDLQAAAELILVHWDFGCGEQHCSEHGSAWEGPCLSHTGGQLHPSPVGCNTVLHPEILGISLTGHISFGAPTPQSPSISLCYTVMEETALPWSLFSPCDTWCFSGNLSDCPMSQCWVWGTFTLQEPYHGNEFWNYSFLENSIPVDIRQIREGLNVLQLRKTFLGVQLEQLQRELKGKDESIPTGHILCGAWWGYLVPETPHQYWHLDQCLSCSGSESLHQAHKLCLCLFLFLPIPFIPIVGAGYEAVQWH